MRKYYIIILFLLVNAMTTIYAQERPRKHTVLSGETVEIIAKKYGLSSNDLYQLNPDLIYGVKENDVLIVSKAKNDNSSEETIFHLVQPNETKYGLSKKYRISIQELERQNPHIISMLQKGHELKIQVKSLKNEVIANKPSSTENAQYSTYLVESGETLYGISKHYRMTVSELVDLNKDILGPVLLSGQTLRVPATKEQRKVDGNSEYQFYTVEAGDTKYGLSKRHKISIGELEILNPQIIPMLKKGEEIRFPKNKTQNAIAVQKNVIIETPAVQEKSIVKQESLAEKKDSEVQPKTQIDPNNLGSEMISYEVKPQETLYGLSKKAGLTQEKLIELNPELNNGVKAGMILTIPSNAMASESPVLPNSSIVVGKGLLNTIQKNTQKDIAFLMPFSEAQYLEFLKLPIIESNLKKDFDFYAGASMAVDSLKKIQVVAKSKILKTEDSQSSEKNFSNLVDANIQGYKMVFSPNEDFDSEKIGAYLSKNNIPLIVSGDKDNFKTTPSTYCSVPSDIHLKKLILDYLISKNENLIVVNDPSRTENKEFITKNYPVAKFADFNDKGVLNTESLKNLLSPTKKNYIVLDTDKAGLILTSTTLLLKESSTFNIQIALLEPIEALKEEGLSTMRFKALKMIYPSLTKPSNLKEINEFKNKFFKRYNFNPSKDAVAGFDITFDALMRLFQEKEFEVIANELTTEQINFKFKYVKNSDGGYFNSGGYILQFDEDSNKKIIN